MVADPTINSIAFIKTFDNEEGSERRSTTRGINTPDVLTIRNAPYTDPVTKVPGIRYTAEIRRHDLDGSSEPYASKASVSISVPSTENNTDLAVLVATLKAFVAHADYIAAMLNNER
jgi:hypothetical protein